MQVQLVLSHQLCLLTHLEKIRIMKAQIISILKKFHLTNEIGTYDEAAEAIMALRGETQPMKALYKELQERMAYLESEPPTSIQTYQMNELNLVMVRIGQVLLAEIKPVCDHIRESDGMVCTGGWCSKCNSIV